MHQYRYLLSFIAGAFGWIISSTGLSADTVSTQTIDETVHAEKIDGLVFSKIQTSELTPAPISDEHTFTRRVYLDTIGRIPTVSELETYINYEHPNKRNRLIDHLSRHPGRTSHQFNIWADLLRIKSQTRQQPGVGAAYANWVKEAISSNMPYDQFVRELVTAEGYPWENGAIGYSMRDAGMPLDNLSNTIQVFLGTQIVCAQCHDHPFDDWTQHQYYETAAMTYGLHNRINYRQKEGFVEFRNLLKDSTLDKKDKERVRIAAGRAFRPLSYGNSESKRQLKLPHDYQYNDAEPKQVVEPYPLYGEIDETITIDNRLQVFSEWLTDSENPRFAKTIANRTWKRLMGVGLFEPVDDYRPTSDISNPDLLEYLETLLVDLDFDLQAFERILLKTETYQRVALPYTPEDYTSYAFEGQQLKRLSAEQLWDSIIAIVTEDPESIQRPYNPELLFNGQLALLSLTPYQMAHLSLEYANKDDELREGIIRITKESRLARESGNQNKVRNLQKELGKLTRERRQLMETLSLKYQGMPADAKSYASSMNSMSMMGGEMMDSSMSESSEAKGALLQKMRRLRTARASELQSPTNPGHLLRELGQSDRELIDNASTEPTVPQALAMMNGTWQAQLWSKNSTLRKRVYDTYETDEKLDLLFQSTLSRPATPEEHAILTDKMETGEYSDKELLWALLNTRQFMFIQ
ncbi:MAG: DUF1549 domain-containing protein [Opitutales bacterium]